MLSLNHVFKFGTTILTALVLSACGSSGGGGDNQDSSPVNNNELNQSNTLVNNNVVQQQANKKTGTAFIDDNGSFRRVTINGYNTTSINVEGINLEIGFPDISAGGWTKTTANDRRIDVCCGRYSDIRFGINDSLDDNGKFYLFYNGNPTLNMPTSGSASYSGQSILAIDITESDEDDYHIGNSQFSVDFGNKSLSGSLGINGIQYVNINASISGNSFNGYANTSLLPSSVASVEGKFYGEQAKQLAGLAEANDNNWAAAFGAQKQ